MHSSRPSGSILAVVAALTITGLACSASDPEAIRATCEETGHGRFLSQTKSVLYVSDLKRSTRFYVDVLGFETDSDADNPIYSEMFAGDLKFGLHAPTSAREEARVGQQRLYFRVADVAAHRKRVVACGAEAGPIEETDWMTMFSVTDPDGHQITFAQSDPAKHSIDPW